MKGHIRTVLHQLRLRVVQIEMESTALPDDIELKKLIINNYYYKKILPMILCDSLKEQYLFLDKKVMQNGVLTDVCDVSVDLGV